MTKPAAPYTLVAFGDMMLQKSFARGPELGPMREMIAEADHAFANLETVLSVRGEQADKFVCLRADPALVQDVLDLGIDVVTGANNHSMDFGMTGLRDTMATCRSAGLPLVGVGETMKDSLAAAVLERNGLRVAFLGMSAVAADKSAGETRPGIAGIRIFTNYVMDPALMAEGPGGLPYVETKPMPGDFERVEEAVATAKKDADLVIVGMHWGIPYGWGSLAQHEICEFQSPLGHRLIDAGADAIIGHHPHYLQGVEVYRDKPIFYSLGNFVWHRVTARKVHRPYPLYTWGGKKGAELSTYTGMVRMNWVDKSAAPTIEFVPLRHDENGNPRACTPEEADFAFTRIEEGSEIYNTKITRKSTRQGDILVISA